MNQLEKKCLIGLFALPIGVSTIAFALLSHPAKIACHSVDKTTSASIRLHCAQQRAQYDTPESLAAAIELLENVPIDDPYHQQSTQLVQRWSNDLLAKAETEVQAGNLDKGISIVRSLPEDAKVRSWKLLWQKGESLMKTALTQVEKRKWQQAFQTASQLRTLENNYWATEQYNSLVQQIQTDRELHDWKLKNPIEPRKPIKEIEFDLPKPEKVARSTRSLWKPQEDAPISRSVSAIEPSKPKQPKPEIKPEPISQVQPSPELEPEPPIEVQPQAPKVEIPAPQPDQKSDRT